MITLVALLAGSAAHVQVDGIPQGVDLHKVSALESEMASCNSRLVSGLDLKWFSFIGKTYPIPLIERVFLYGNCHGGNVHHFERQMNRHNGNLPLKMAAIAMV